MAGWKDILNEVKEAGSTHDIVRRKHLASVSELTGRNAIFYYSAWLEKVQFARQGVTGFEVNDNDKNGLMAAIHGMERDRGLDLILHTPGGETAATESLVDYLRLMFGSNIRVIVPHLAMSAGTMIALSASKILMGKHSSLGPIDPQIFGMPAHAVVEEFERARAEIKADHLAVALWQPIINKYSPTLIGECEKAITWSTEMVRTWLETGMFRDLPANEVKPKIDKIIAEFGDHALNKSHARHIGAQKAKDLGLEVGFLEDDQRLQEAVLTAYHAFVATASDTGLIKIIESHLGVSHVSLLQIQAVPAR